MILTITTWSPCRRQQAEDLHTVLIVCAISFLIDPIYGFSINCYQKNLIYLAVILMLSYRAGHRTRNPLLRSVISKLNQKFGERLHLLEETLRYLQQRTLGPTQFSPAFVSSSISHIVHNSPAQIEIITIFCIKRQINKFVPKQAN